MKTALDTFSFFALFLSFFNSKQKSVKDSRKNKARINYARAARKKLESNGNSEFYINDNNPTLKTSVSMREETESINGEGLDILAKKIHSRRRHRDSNATSIFSSTREKAPGKTYDYMRSHLRSLREFDWWNAGTVTSRMLPSEFLLLRPFV